jgi:hypothetical protein
MSRRTCLLLLALAPGFAFPDADPELKANALPVLPYLGIGSSEFRISTIPVPPAGDPVRQGTIVVVPDTEDLAPPEKNRWVKFQEALGPGRTVHRQFRTYGWRNNDGTRVECYTLCVVACCVGSGGFSNFGEGGHF